MIWMPCLTSMGRGEKQWKLEFARSVSRRDKVRMTLEDVWTGHVVHTRERWSCLHRHRPVKECLLLEVPSRYVRSQCVTRGLGKKVKLQQDAQDVFLTRQMIDQTQHRAKDKARRPAGSSTGRQGSNGLPRGAACVGRQS